jgi:hypothetical protein
MEGAQNFTFIEKGEKSPVVLTKHNVHFQRAITKEDGLGDGFRSHLHIPGTNPPSNACHTRQRPAVLLEKILVPGLSSSLIGAQPL